MVIVLLVVYLLIDVVFSLIDYCIIVVLVDWWVMGFNGLLSIVVVIVLGLVVLSGVILVLVVFGVWVVVFGVV